MGVLVRSDLVYLGPMTFCLIVTGVCDGARMRPPLYFLLFWALIYGRRDGSCLFPCLIVAIREHYFWIPEPPPGSSVDFALWGHLPRHSGFLL